jgi:hypothetical protein
MLHTIPHSSKRTRLLVVVKMQCKLMGVLCGLKPGATVDLAWLQRVWSRTPAKWIQRFWENDKGNRASWISTIAAASSADKRVIRDLIAEQLRFHELYLSPPTVRLRKHNWAGPTFEAANKLLKSFYAPLFYKDEGFAHAEGCSFHKDHLIEGFSPRIKICPYTDNVIHDTKLDHFLPKDQFPMLSCHPDNLMPCSTDANSGGHKGTDIPLDLGNANQAETWFHPRWRSAKDKYRLTFAAGPTSRPVVQFVAMVAQDQPRLDNMARMFDLSDFWGGFLDDEVQNVASDVHGWLKKDGKQPTDATVKEYVLQRAHQEQGRIGKDGLAIAKSYFYEHIANTPVLLAQVVRICASGT